MERVAFRGTRKKGGHIHPGGKSSDKDSKATNTYRRGHVSWEGKAL